MTMLGIRRYPTLLFSLMGLFLFVTVGTSTSYAEEGLTNGKPALPGEDCQTNSLESWKAQEKWVWEQVCAGKIANFNLAKDYGGSLDPKEPKGWSEKRILRPAFLETILLHEPYRGALTRHGVRIVGAWFKKSIDLSHASLTHQLWLDNCRFDSDVDLTNLRTNFLISLEGSKFKGKLDMNSLDVTSSLFMSGGAEFDKEVVLGSAKVGGQLDMSGSKFKGKLDMNSLDVTSSLFMRDGAEFDKEVVLLSAKVGGQLDMSGSKFKDKLDMDSLDVTSHLFMRDGAEFDKEVDIGSAKVGGQLDMSGSKFKGKLDMNSLDVTSSLFMRDGAEFGKEVVLLSAKVGGQLDMSGSKFKGKLDMDKLQVEESLFMRGDASFAEDVSLIFSKIGSNLDISNSSLVSLDLTGTKIGGEFRLGSMEHPAPKWQPGSKLTLRNTQVEAVQDLPEAWPNEVDLCGFTYVSLGGFAADSKTDMASRDVSWLTKKWLEKQMDYSPQPYKQLASVLRNAGYSGKANDILYASRERERAGATGLRWWGLTLLNYLIGYGYGYRYFYSLFWIVGVLALGTAVLRLTGEHKKQKIPLGIAYSLDMLLPIIRLRERHYEDVDLSALARYYFYGHKLMGYILASFLIAGLSGLTK